MTKRMIRIVSGLVVCFALVGCFIAAEYCEMLGFIYKDGGKRLRFAFRFEGLNAQEHLADVTVRVLYQGNALICNHAEQPDSEGAITGHVMIPWSWKKTFLFEKPNFHRTMRCRELEFVFIHPCYEEHTRIFRSKEINTVQEIRLIPIDPPDVLGTGSQY